MSSRFSFASLVTASALLGCSQLSAPLTPPESGGSQWMELQSNHFILDTDLERADAESTLTELEVIFRSLEDVAFTAQREPKIPIRVVIFDRERDYRALAPPSSAGYFRPSLSDEFDGIPTMVLARGLTDTTRLTFQHELSHLFIRWCLGPVPVWLNEGMAQYYSTFEVTAGRAIVGKAIPDLGISGNGQWHSTRYSAWDRVVMPVTAVPTAEALIHERYQDFYAAGKSAGRLLDDNRAQAANYLAAWGLVHMLYANPRYQERFNAMINAIANGSEPDAAWSANFGDVAPEELERDFREHLYKATTVEAMAKATRYDLPPPPSFAVKAMSPAEVHVLWARLRHWDENGRGQARQEMAAALRLEPTSPEILLWSGLFALRDQRPDDARAAILTALAARPNDARYLQAMTTVTGGQDLADTIARLGKVASSARALDTVARYDEAHQKTDEGLAFAVRSTRADPTCWRCFLTAAKLYAQKQDYDKALVTAERAARLLPEGASVDELDALIFRVQRLRATPKKDTPKPQDNGGGDEK